jgi:ABC-type sugar transport system ATPase subunit
LPSLEFRDVHKSFGAVRALQGVSFDVASGEVHACVGENGAGKSTLLKILAGITPPDRGEILRDGVALVHRSPREALSGGIGLVFQERLAFPNLSVAANIFAGREICRAGGWLDERSMHARARTLLERLSVPVEPARPMEDVPPAYAQLVQVARALAFDCRILVLDEPTTSLTDAEVDHLFTVLGDLRARGVTMLFVSHRLPEVFRLCDRITVLRDGRYVGTFTTAGTDSDTIVRAMVGREPPARVERRQAIAVDAPRLSLRGVTRRPFVDDVTFDVRPGEIVGVFGLVGSGRTELLEVIFGLARRDAGDVLVEGTPVALTSARDAMAAGIALVPEDRQRLGLHFNLSIADNIALPRAARDGLGRIRRRAERAAAEGAIRNLAIRSAHPDRTPDTLSGGNQQKTATARWLAVEPRILLLDEPTRGVDVGAKFEIHNLIRDRARDGMACVVVSSDLPEVLALADRIVVMREGRIRGELSGATATEESVMQLATHEVEAPA